MQLTPKNITKGMDILRQMKSLRTVKTDLAGGQMRAAEFWKKCDAGDFNK